MNGFPYHDLLATVRDRGYPAEYLYSRIRGRRSRLTADWRRSAYEPSPQLSPRAAAVETSSSIWNSLLREYRWVSDRMNEELRAIAAPFFCYAELRTICICLRGGEEGQAKAFGDLLEASMLSEKIKNVIRTAGNAEEMLKRMERLSGPLSLELKGLSALAKSKGLRTAEQEMTNRYLTAVSRSNLHPLTQYLFRCISDARNILAIAKALRLDRAAKPPVLPGGGIVESRLLGIMKKGDPGELLSLVRKTTGTVIDAFDTTRIEAALYRWITREMRRRGRDPLGIGLILDYLWRCSVEAMNRSMLAHTAEMERDAVMAEMVY